MGQVPLMTSTSATWGVSGIGRARKRKRPLRGECRFCHEWAHLASRCCCKHVYMNNLSGTAARRLAQAPATWGRSPLMTSTPATWGVSSIAQDKAGTVCSLSNVRPLECRNRFAPLSEIDMVPDVGCAGPSRCRTVSRSPPVAPRRRLSLPLLAWQLGQWRLFDRILLRKGVGCRAWVKLVCPQSWAGGSMEQGSGVDLSSGCVRVERW